MSLQQLTVKAHLKRGCQRRRLLEQEDEIRRFAVDYDVSTNYVYLVAKITSVFPGLVNKSITLYWKDADGDMIAFSSDDELMEAIKGISDGVFRVYIVEKKMPKCEAQPSADPSNLLHPGVTCDGCNGEVCGIRYKCTTCPDYDLCSQCKSAGLHGEHEMRSIDRPMWPFGHFGMFYPGGPMASAASAMPQGSPPMPPFMGPMMGHPPPPPPPAYGCVPPPPGPDPQDLPEAYRQCRKAWKRWYKESCGYKQKKDKKDHKQKKEKKSGKSSSSSSSSESDEGNTLTGDYLRNVGHSVAAMLDPLGIDVEVDVEHHGRRKRCHRRGMHGHGHGPWGPRMRGGPWCVRGGPWGMRGRGGRWGCFWADSDRGANTDHGTTPPTAAPSSTDHPQGSSGSADAATAGPQGQNQHPTTNLETGEMASGNFSGSPDCEWTVLDNGPADVESATMGVRELDVSDKLCDDMSGFTIPSDPVIAEALQKMLLMGYNNEGGWLTNLLVQHKGDIGRVLDAIHRKKQ